MNKIHKYLLLGAIGVLFLNTVRFFLMSIVLHSFLNSIITLGVAGVATYFLFRFIYNHPTK